MEAKMQTLTRTTHETTRPAFTAGSLALRLLNRLADLDARYRDRCRLADLSDNVLRDVGLTREDVERDQRGA
jgi:uncharacterized protein YjiS (DUF1127 family)